MYHSVTIGTKNTWTDWHMVPTNRPVFEVPEQKTEVLDIPGANGSIDLSTSLTGYPIFDNREGEWEFLLLNGYGKWEDRYSEILNYLHGKTFDATLEDDPNWYYTGRFYVASVESSSGDTWTKLSIGYSVEPYKKYTTMNTEYQDLAAGTYTIPNSKYGYAPIAPTFVVEDASMTLVFTNAELSTTFTKELSVGTHTLPEVVFYGSSVTCVFTGSGTVSINFRKESL